MQVAALAAQHQLLEAIKTTGTPATYLGSASGAEEMARFYGEQGTGEVRDIESRFGG
jgi:hypothetical protein